jgi:threonine dehydrogenase-like Zn-dependent dehydrogenase
VEVVTADLDPWRLNQSAALGAHRAVEVKADAPMDRDLVGGEFDVAIDAVGTAQTVNACVDLVRPNGLIVLLGTHHVDTHVAVDLITWEKKGLRVHTAAEPTDADRAGAMRVAQRLAPAIALRPLLTDTYPLDRLPEAIERLSASSLLYPAGEPSPYSGPPPRTLKLAIVP